MKRAFLLATVLCLAYVSQGQVALRGLFTPVYLNPDTTVIYLRDYLGTLEAGAVTLPFGLSDRSLKKDTLILTGKPRTHLSTLKIETPEGPKDLLLIASNKKEVTISIPESEIEGEKVRIFGSFNNWNRDSAPLELRDGAYQRTYSLNPGRYEYKLYVNGEEVLDPTNPRKVSNGMGSHNNLLEVKSDNPSIPGGYALSLEDGSINITSTGGPVQYIVFYNNQRLSMKCTKKLPPDCELIIPEEAAGEKRSFVRIYSYQGDKKGKDMLIPLEYGEPLMETTKLDRMDWHQARLYFLMVDRFVNASPANDRKTPDDSIQPIANYMGGDLNGVGEKISDGYFDSLGVNTIWLSPITQNPLDAWGYWDKGEVKSKFSAYHGYWPISNIRVDFRFGSEDELHSLLDKAHGSDKNMLLDYVANHVHVDHPVYQKNKDWATSLYLPDGTKNTELWDEQRLTTWFDDHLPTLDLRRWEIVDPMVDSALVWMTKYSFDGFRHDATKHIDELYWRTLTYRLRKNTAKPIYQIGETYGSPQLINSYISTGMLDAQFDFNLYDAAVNAFSSSNGDLQDLVNKLDQSLSVYGDHHLMGNITGNQDRSRFISLASGDVSLAEDVKLAGWERDIGKPDSSAYKRLAILHAFNNAIPGIPVTYYGDEIGMPGAGDPDNRRMMKFEELDSDEQDLLKQVKALNHLRANEMALLYGSTETNVSRSGVLSIIREYFDQKIWIVVNRSNTNNRIGIPAALMDKDLKPLLQTPSKQREGQVSLPPLSYQYFKVMPSES